MVCELELGPHRCILRSAAGSGARTALEPLVETVSLLVPTGAVPCSRHSTSWMKLDPCRKDAATNVFHVHGCISAGPGQVVFSPDATKLSASEEIIPGLEDGTLVLRGANGISLHCSNRPSRKILCVEFMVTAIKSGRAYFALDHSRSDAMADDFVNRLRNAISGAPLAPESALSLRDAVLLEEISPADTASTTFGVQHIVRVRFLLDGLPDLRFLCPADTLSSWASVTIGLYSRGDLAKLRTFIRGEFAMLDDGLPTTGESSKAQTLLGRVVAFRGGEFDGCEPILRRCVFFGVLDYVWPDDTEDGVDLDAYFPFDGLHHTRPMAEMSVHLIPLHLMPRC